MERKVTWEQYSKEDLKKIFSFAEGYKAFLSKCKTERECVNEFVIRAKQEGYHDLKDIIREERKLEAGDKIYVNHMGKCFVSFILGKNDLSQGMNILGAHIDSPRIDLKQNPLYEDNGLAMLDTHYYGGIKKYQWVTIPLALHGVIAKKDGTVIPMVIGEKDSDPVLGISDLLVHLAADQMDKKAAKVIEGENLDIMAASMPLMGKNDLREAVSANLLHILKEDYNIEEEDFLSAEIEAVPAGTAKDYGFDRSMVMGYGHDDRVCAYSSFEAMLQIKGIPDTTSVCILVDKEEVGNQGATGMFSRFFENAVAEILNAIGNYNEINVRRALSNSRMISSDVSAGYDPNYPSVFEKKNTAFCGKGLVFNKYSGVRGKRDANDANAEFIADIRKIMDEAGVCFQTAELGKVDQGGGGTIAHILARYGMQVLDGGIAVINMHAPWEIVSKADLYEAWKGYIAFLKKA